MVRHVILWKLKEEYTASEKQAIKAGIKQGLEALAGVIPGLVSIHVYTGGLASSKNADAMLDAVFTDAEALAAYAEHPAHLAVAESRVRPHVAHRACFDFETD